MRKMDRRGFMRLAAYKAIETTGAVTLGGALAGEFIQEGRVCSNAKNEFCDMPKNPENILVLEFMKEYGMSDQQKAEELINRMATSMPLRGLGSFLSTVGLYALFDKKVLSHNIGNIPRTVFNFFASTRVADKLDAVIFNGRFLENPKTLVDDYGMSRDKAELFCSRYCRNQQGFNTVTSYVGVASYLITDGITDSDGGNNDFTAVRVEEPEEYIRRLPELTAPALQNS